MSKFHSYSSEECKQQQWETSHRINSNILSRTTPTAASFQSTPTSIVSAAIRETEAAITCLQNFNYRDAFGESILPYDDIGTICAKIADDTNGAACATLCICDEDRGAMVKGTGVGQGREFRCSHFRARLTIH